MPSYSYGCDTCGFEFELFFYIKDYNANPKCLNCDNYAHRLYVVDVLSQSASVKKSDSELKTIGDLAMRNSERMSEDQKISLYQKHNSYKDTKEEPKSLPSGMSRIKKPPKTVWPGSKDIKKKRSPKK
jgi:putative FmdB family regulatory protein